MNQESGPHEPHDPTPPEQPESSPRPRAWNRPAPRAESAGSGTSRNQGFRGVGPVLNWLALGVLTIVIVAVQSLGGGGPGHNLPKDPARVSNIQLKFAGKYYLGVRSLLGGDFAEQVGKQFATTFDAQSMNAIDRLRLVTFIAESGDTGYALDLIESLGEDLETSIEDRKLELESWQSNDIAPDDDSTETEHTEESSDKPSQEDISSRVFEELILDDEVLTEEERKEKQEQIEICEALLQDVAILESVYENGPASLSDEDRARLTERHPFFGDVALAYGTDVNDPIRRKIESAGTTLLVMLFLALGAVAVFGITGLILLIIAITKMIGGDFKWRMQPAVDAARPMTTSLMQVLILFLVAFLLLTGIGGAIESLFEEPPAFSPVIILMWLALPVMLWPKIVGARWSDLRTAIGWHRGEGFFKECFAGIVGYIAGLPILGCAFLLVFLIMAIQSMAGGDGAAPSHPAVEEMIGGGLWKTIALYSLACVWAPIVEETMFRGAFFASLRARFGTVIEPAIISAFIFAAIHPQGFVALPALMTLALIFAFIREWRGSCIGPMIAHALNNFLVITFFSLAIA